MIRDHINAVLLTILVHLLIVLVALLLQIRTEVRHIETPLIIDPETFVEEVEENENENEEQTIEDADVEKFLANMTAAGSNYKGVNENLRDNKDLSMDEIRKMYEEEILREKYGDDYEAHKNPTPGPSNENDVRPVTNPDNKTNQTIDNSNRPCLVKAILDDNSRATRYLHIPVFTCRGSGTVEIGITISQEGKVTSTKLLSVSATADKDCLVEAASSAAKKSRFAIVAGKTQQGGKIIYTFMTQ
ncbi:MAG TPA: hypothetical protein PLA77_00845 [Bacteroidales bacterium]|nr:hypothetical protein [Bacteroidales bacterium]